MLERRLWIAVLAAQRDLGVDVPDGVIEAYEKVVDDVDLDSIRRREAVTRHDVKARIEEFSALAGHEHVHKGMTSRDLTENVEQLQVRSSLELVRDRAVAALARLARLAAEHDELVIAGRSHNVAAQATTLGKRFASAADELLIAVERVECCSSAIRCAASRARSVRRRTSSTCSTATPTSSPQLEQRVATHLGFDAGADQRRPGLPALARLRRRSPRWCSSLPGRQPRDDDPADGRAGARDRGIPGRPGRVQRDAAQDEHPLVRAGQRSRRRAARLPVDGRRARRRRSGTRATCPARSCAGSRCRTRSSPSTGCSRRSSPCSTSSAPTRRWCARELDRYLPFLATTKVLMAAVRNGVGREQAHAASSRSTPSPSRSGCASRAATDNDLFDRLAGDARLGLSRRTARRARRRPVVVHRRGRRAGRRRRGAGRGRRTSSPGGGGVRAGSDPVAPLTPPGRSRTRDRPALQGCSICGVAAGQVERGSARAWR